MNVSVIAAIMWVISEVPLHTIPFWKSYIIFCFVNLQREDLQVLQSMSTACRSLSACS
jgi:hypothetical protein